MADFADKLDTLARDIGDVPRHELAAILRRAAIRIRSTPPVVDEDVEQALALFMRDLDLDRSSAIRRLVAEALIVSGYMLYRELDEDTETVGEA